jgi:hypothetical protein
LNWQKSDGCRDVLLRARNNALHSPNSTARRSAVDRHAGPLGAIPTAVKIAPNKKAVAGLIQNASVRWLARGRSAQTGQLRVRSRQLTAQRCYHRGQLVVDLGQQLGFERNEALLKFGLLLREDFVAFGALAREHGIVLGALVP